MFEFAATIWLLSRRFWWGGEYWHLAALQAPRVFRRTGVGGGEAELVHVNSWVIC